ncbi:MAG: glycoside hydrolase family 31 protein, partial [Vulcanisaeta sp. AZ3]
KVREVIRLRYEFLPYLSALALEAHERGHPILRPLVYYHQDDDNVHMINDEFYVGPYLLYAPQLGKESRRLVYLPGGKWLDYWDDAEYEGPTWIEARNELPIYLRYGSVIPLNRNGTIDLVIYGDGGNIKLRDGTLIMVSNDRITLNKPMRLGSIEVRGEAVIRAQSENSELKVEVRGRRSLVIINNEVNEITLSS